MLQTSMIKSGLALALLLSVAGAGVAQADVLHEIDLGQPAHVLTLPPGHQVLIDLNNTTTTSQSFHAPYHQLHTVVPAGETRFLAVNPDIISRRLEYKIGDCVNVAASANTASRMEAINAIDLTSILNPNTAYSAQNDPEPSYYTHTTSKREMVRGYW